jgi:xanthosine utilization system XapX-like protein
MAEESQSESHRDTVARIRAAESFAVNLPVLGRIRIPKPEQIAYFGALGALAAFEIIDWPIALAIAAGHALAQNQHSRVAEEIGEALEEA